MDTVAGCRLLVMLVLSVTTAACAGGAGSRSTPPTPTEPTTTSSSTSSPSPSPSDVAKAALLPNGILSARLGDPWFEVVPALTAVFGPADRRVLEQDEQLQGYFADPGAVGTLRTISWDPLTLVFLDRSGELPVPEVPFAAWFSGWSEGTRGFTTPEGIGIGDTLRALEAAYGDSLTVPKRPGGPCGTSWTFVVETPDGTYRGTFDGEPTSDRARIGSIGVGELPSC